VVLFGHNGVLSSSIFLGQFISFQPLKWVGGFWMAILGYSLLLLPIANVVIYFTKKRAVYWVGLGIFTFFLFVLAYGSFNAWSPVVREYDLKIDKEAQLDELKILMVSDIHLGEIVGVKHLQRLVDIVEDEKPDAVLIPGDIIDDHIEPFIVDQLVKGLDQTKPIIMMDHQPYDLDIAQASGIDLLLAGHTHRGQLAPAHLITGMIYENDWGYLQKGDLHSLVSSGFGTWGPPLRLGSRSEVFVINVEFAGKEG
jgi:predicted MPP superfamily phosphohydrolase